MSMVTGAASSTLLIILGLRPSTFSKSLARSCAAAVIAPGSSGPIRMVTEELITTGEFVAGALEFAFAGAVPMYSAISATSTRFLRLILAAFRRMVAKKMFAQR